MAVWEAKQGSTWDYKVYKVYLIKFPLIGACHDKKGRGMIYGDSFKHLCNSL